uniref:Uncharacterized protein n=1 Tax=Ursus americanus TaxID=9643 RepID=A0A452RFC9_URSAM
MCGRLFPWDQGPRFFLKVTEGTWLQPARTTRSWLLGTRPRRGVVSPSGGVSPASSGFENWGARSRGVV